MMSSYLQQKIEPLHLSKKFQQRIALIDTDTPKWINTIKGDDINNYYPAKIFFEELIPKYLPEYIYIQQLIIPEVSINEITEIDSEKFINQQVDFYLPQAKLVIEIDGQQHKFNDVNRIKDNERDEHLAKFDIVTIRIDTKDLEAKNHAFQEKIEEIRSVLNKNNKILKFYEKQYKNRPNLMDDKFISQALTATAIIRFQVLLLSLLEKGDIKISDRVWNLNVLHHDIKDFVSLAYDDLFLWIEHLSKLSKLKFSKPKLVTKSCTSDKDFCYEKGHINIDFSLLKRWTDDCKKDVIYVRTDYFDRANYFQLSTADPVKYKIINDGEDSDIPALKFLLKNIFGFDEFNDGQLPIITSALAGETTIGLLPTGSGKSLCYQFTALLQPCASFIVCPIKSLMYDQKENLDSRYITNTAYISSDQDGSEKKLISDNFSKGKYQFIWISPERFQTKEFRDYLSVLNRTQTIALAIVDEVHCLSEWGHDFRTSYLNLIRTIEKYCPSAWFLGLTATASNFVLEDIRIEFKAEVQNIKTLTSFTRPELTFKVIKDYGNDKRNKRDELNNILRRLHNQESVFELNNEHTKSGLIFTLFKNGENGCYKLANHLSTAFNAPVKWYSGDVPEVSEYKNGKYVGKSPVMPRESFAKHKQEVQKEYKNNKIPLLVATKAFGMGIDKSNIRYTIHYGIPGSLEALYQEAGRAGRDKKPADCYVLYTPEKIESARLNRLFDLDTTVEEIRAIQNDVQYDSRDILGNFFLWLSNNKDVDEEFKLINLIFRKYSRPGKTLLVKCKGLNSSFSEVQKAIYRLSLIGVVEDWTIEDWDKTDGMLEVEFKSFNDNTMVQSLTEYIQKYDKKFDLANKKAINEDYQKYHEIFIDKSIPMPERIIKILLRWNYDNVVYNRRQSIKTIMSLCDNYSDSEMFKLQIERYFKFTEKTYLLDHVSQNPDDYLQWFEIFYKITEAEAKKIIDINDILDIQGSLSRFLESFRYNTGLNFISGLIKLLVDDYKSQDGQARLESAFKQINNYDVQVRNEILDQTLEIGAYLDKSNKIYLSRLLCQYYDDQVVKVYDKLKDDYSLDIFLKKSVKRLDNIGGKLTW